MKTFDQFYDAVIEDTNQFWLYEIQSKHEINLPKEESRETLQRPGHVRTTSKKNSLATLQREVF
jgi:hypothetical protein